MAITGYSERTQPTSLGTEIQQLSSGQQTSSEQQRPYSSGIKWIEVLGMTKPQPDSSQPESFGQVKEKMTRLFERGEAEVSKEALALAEDNLVELFYLIGKGNVLPQELSSLQKIITSIIPQFDELNKLDPIAAISKYQEVVRGLLEDKERRGQLLLLAVSYQDYKWNVLKKAYGVKVTVESGEKKEEEVDKKARIDQARKSLQRDPKVVVIDQEGRIIPQPGQLSRDEYINQRFKEIPVPFWMRLIIGGAEKVEAYQKRKAGEEYDQYTQLLILPDEEQETRSLRFNFQSQTPQMLSDEEKNFLTELGFFRAGNIESHDKVLGDLMREMQATYTFRREILLATGMPKKEVVKAIIEDQFPLIPELSNLSEVIEGQIKKAKEEAASKVQRALEQRRKEATRAQLEKRKKELEEREQKLLQELEKAKKARGDEAAHEKTSASDIIQTKIEALLGSLPSNIVTINDIDELLYIVGLRDQQPGNNPIETLLFLNMEIAALEQDLEIRGFKELQEEEKRLKQRKERLEELLTTKTIETRAKDGTIQTQTVDPEQVKDQIREIDNKINNLISEELKEKNADLTRKKAKKAIIEAFLNQAIIIEGEKKSIEDWLREYARQTPSATTTAETDLAGELETTRLKLAQVRGLMSYYDENELTGRSQRILQYQGLDPSVAGETLSRIETLNPRLHQLLEKCEEGDRQNIVFVLIQAFGEKLVIPDDPNSQAVTDIISMLEAEIKGEGEGGQLITKITTTDELDKLLKQLAHQILKSEEEKQKEGEEQKKR